jgi:two-component system LytT family response regulator
MLRAVLIDDEPLAILRLEQLLADESDVKIVARCSSASVAVKTLSTITADLVFLDVELGGDTGFDVLDALPVECAPAIIFVTAYDRYAVRAFEVCALDYLLKPVDRERFAVAMARARARLAAGDLEARTARDSGPVLARSHGRIVALQHEEIDWVEAAGNYLLLHAGPKAHLVRSTLTRLLERLEPSGFVRIHRSAVVNLARVREVRATTGGDALAILRDGIDLAVSRRYYHSLVRRLK